MTARPPASLAVTGLSHRYRGAAVPALDGVSFRVEPGARVGLLGPNGAGKSTLMRLVCGYLPVQAAADTTVRVGDVDVTRDSLRARRMVGYLPEQVPLYVELRVREHLEFRAAIKGVPRRERLPEIHRVAARTGLEGMLEAPILRLSRGYRQRVGIADALLGAPPLVVLDEPTVGLDPNQVLEIRAMLRALGGGQTLIFSSHILAEVEALCDRVVILARGKLVADESVAESLNTTEVVAMWDDESGTAGSLLDIAVRTLHATRLDLSSGTDEPTLGRMAGELGLRVLESEIAGELYRVRVVCPTPAVAEALAMAIGRTATARGVALVRLELGRRKLEERFARVTAGEGASA
jgi:ABC-2 type transport system ATP-binding protein